MRGCLIVIEGPNGVGKTTTATLLSKQLRREHDVIVHALSQPSDTPLGRLLRSGEAYITERSLAMAIAADRLHQYESTAGPALERGEWVVMDRYVPSSLVLQSIDGLEFPEIWEYNKWVPPPDLLFYLVHSAEEITIRMRARGKLSRLEQIGTPARELALYSKARAFLEGVGYRQQVTIDCRGLTPEMVIAAITPHIRQLQQEGRIWQKF